jgi:hypothetical protein
MTNTVQVPASTPCIAPICFMLSGISAVIGNSLGIFMGITEDHTLAPVHVHINLIGWVSLFLFGVYYHLHPHVVGWIVKLQVALVACGYPAAFGSLAVMMTHGDRSLLPVTIVGSLMVFVGFVLFCFVVCSEVVRFRKAAG